MELLPDGRITFDPDDGHGDITLRRPKYGAFKRFRLAIVEMGREGSEALEKAREIEDVDEQNAAITAAEEQTVERVVAMWRDIVTTLGDRALPDDVDEWPVELIVGQSVISRVITHWRTVPLDRGEMGHPTPSI